MPSSGNVPRSEIKLQQRFGQGVVTRLNLRLGSRNRRAAELLCDCGTIYTALLIHLRGGLVNSCGCLRRETCRQTGMQTATHGLSKHPLYQTWTGIMDRCENPRAQRYRDYGGRGIEVCTEWHDVRVFIAYIERELGPRPPGMSLDRIRNNGNYEPGNVRWNGDTGQYENTDRRGRDPVTGKFVSAWSLSRRCWPG